MRLSLLALALIAVFSFSNEANAQTVRLSNTPATGDVLSVPIAGPVASSTNFVTQVAQSYYARFIEPENNDLARVTRVYVFACGVPSGGGSHRITGVRDGVSTVFDFSSTSATVRNCTPTFFDDNKGNFLQWSYFNIDHTFQVGDTFFYRINQSGGDFGKVESESNSFFYRNDGAGYTQSTGNFLPNTTPNFKVNSDFSQYFVMVDQNTGGSGTIGTTTLSQNFSTRFTDGSFSGLASTTDLNVEYFLSTSEFNSNNRPDAININILADNVFNDQQVYSQQKLILPLTDGNQSKTIPIDYFFEDGNYTAFINFWNINSNFITFSATGLEINFTVSGGEVTVSEVSEIFDGTDLENDLSFQECSFTSISGCFVNLYTGLINAVTPSQTSFAQFGNLWQVIQNKPPFGYVTSMVALFTGFDANASPAFDFGTLPFLGALFDPFNLLLASLLWFVYGVWLYRRLMKLDI